MHLDLQYIIHFSNRCCLCRNMFAYIGICARSLWVCNLVQTVEGEGERGQLRVGAADLQCGVAVETVDSQNPSSYADYTSVCVSACTRICAIVSDMFARAHEEQREEG